MRILMKKLAIKSISQVKAEAMVRIKMLMQVLLQVPLQMPLLVLQLVMIMPELRLELQLVLLDKLRVTISMKRRQTKVKTQRQMPLKMVTRAMLVLLQDLLIKHQRIKAQLQLMEVNLQMTLQGKETMAILMLQMVENWSS